MKVTFIYIVCMLLFVSFLQAQEVSDTNFPPPDIPVEIKAAKITGKISLDGRLDELELVEDQFFNNYLEVKPLQREAFQYPKTVCMLFDENNVCVGVFSKDAKRKDGTRKHELRKHFNTIKNDVFGIQIDALNTKQYTVFFQTTPSKYLALESFDNRISHTNWNAIWRVYAYTEALKGIMQNLLMSWEYPPLSFIYFAFNDKQKNQFNPVQQTRHFRSKITFLK